MFIISSAVPLKQWVQEVVQTKKPLARAPPNWSAPVRGPWAVGFLVLACECHGGCGGSRKRVVRHFLFCRVIRSRGSQTLRVWKPSDRPGVARTTHLTAEIRFQGTTLSVFAS